MRDEETDGANKAGQKIKEHHKNCASNREELLDKCSSHAGQKRKRHKSSHQVVSRIKDPLAYLPHLRGTCPRWGQHFRAPTSMDPQYRILELYHLHPGAAFVRGPYLEGELYQE
ncbi:hypothetical protein TNIN_312211 [Trichonephila inaurata madagascariensis]|uniref:Uncharacterized protein n=1 Tax=Trichonephila inaurata madagascariensis TaxID=2747483 RepID=A0A8X6IH78_9ARAC|nr:hypothetical protein TNIN_312211 [Trichonephila inaurata madagascariensis]